MTTLKDDIGRIINQHVQQGLNITEYVIPGMNPQFEQRPGKVMTCVYINPHGSMHIRADAATTKQWEQAKQVLIETTFDEALQLLETTILFGVSRIFYQQKKRRL